MFKQYGTHVLLTTLCLLASHSCASATSTPLPLALTPSASPQATEVPMAAALTPTPAVTLPMTDQLVFTITNPESYSGRQGEPRPDWLGWGAGAFSVAPDGTFWIADTGPQPERLLHVSAQGELLGTFPVDGSVAHIHDLAATHDAVWVLDLSAQPPRVVRFGVEGGRQRRADLPATIGNLWTGNLWISHEGAVWVGGRSVLFECIDPAGEVVCRELEGFSYHGHTYVVMKQTYVVDGLAVDIPVPAGSDAEPFLGFAPNGNFFIVPAADQYVEAYTPAGDRVGVARRRPGALPAPLNRDLAVGPDGQVYQMVFNPDHSVQVFRLGFAADVRTLPTLIPTPRPTRLTPVLPAWELPPPGATDQELARETLLTFFFLLSEGRHSEAAALYGGTYEEFPGILPPADEGAFWKSLCQVWGCGPVSAVVEEKQVAEDEFLFYFELMKPNGTRFEYGPCCGAAPGTVLPVWQFGFPVKKEGGAWKLIRWPLITP